MNASIQFYSATLSPIGNNIRISRNTWDPQLNSPHAYAANDLYTFIGDYFGNTFDVGNTVYGTTAVTTSVTTYNDGGNPQHYQQQVVSFVPIPST